MIELFTKFLPYALVFYFLYRYMKEPIFLLGIPFMLFFRQSIFVDKAFIFVQPGTWDNELKFLGWLILVWLSISLKSHFNFQREEKFIFHERGINFLDFIVIFLILVTIAGLIIALNGYYIKDNVYTQFLTLFALFLGYFIIKDIFRYSTPQGISDFLFNIVLINTLASSLYIIHQGLHINLYGEHREYLSLSFQGSQITRTFVFMPVLWFFSISYLLVFNTGNKIINTILLSINILAVFISYTRSFLLDAVLVYLLYIFLSVLKSRNYWRSIKNLIFVGVAGIVFFMILSTVLPANTNYFIGRFEELNEKPADRSSNNLVYRFYRTGQLINQMSPDKVLLGHGSVTESQMPSVEQMKGVTADMAWAGVIFRWGYLGGVLFFLFFITGMGKALLLYLRSDGVNAQLVLLLLLTLFSQVIESFTSWTFMSPNRFPMGLWYFGVLSALITFHINQERIKLNANINQK